jgi:hypothetical protein
MLYGNHTSLIFENVKSNLLSKENFDVDSRSESKGEGFIVQVRIQQVGSSNKPKSRSKSRDRKPNIFCRYCKADNHVISQCPKLKNKEERQKKKEVDKSAAEASIVENSDGGEALMITSNDKKRMAWVLDSACSFHICSHREWFSDYSNFNDVDLLVMNLHLKFLELDMFKLKFMMAPQRYMNRRYLSRHFLGQFNWPLPYTDCFFPTDDFDCFAGRLCRTTFLFIYLERSCSNVIPDLEKLTQSLSLSLLLCPVYLHYVGC